jgi:GNAT superfamily N-acetyltransferase
VTQVRPAQERDLDALAAFEVDIARISFPGEAVDDPQVHRRKLAKALEKDPAGMFVAVDAADRPVGWLWMAVNQNFLTGNRYVNFRSLAVADVPDRAAVGEALLERGLAFGRDAGATSVVGKVHFGNQGMRVLYRKYGFEAAHLTMRLRLDPGDGPGDPGGGGR